MRGDADFEGDGAKVMGGTVVGTGHRRELQAVRKDAVEEKSG
jgi:hypothetical protein